MLRVVIVPVLLMAWKAPAELMVPVLVRDETIPVFLNAWFCIELKVPLFVITKLLPELNKELPFNPVADIVPEFSIVKLLLWLKIPCASIPLTDMLPLLTREPPAIALSKFPANIIADDGFAIFANAVLSWNPFVVIVPRLITDVLIAWIRNYI